VLRIILYNNLCIILYNILYRRTHYNIYIIIYIISDVGKTIKIKMYWRDTNLQLNIKKTDTKDSLFPWDKTVHEVEGVIVGDTIILNKIKENDTVES